MAPGSKRKWSWKTIAGVLTAVAALVGAIAGLVNALRPTKDGAPSVAQVGNGTNVAAGPGSHVEVGTTHGGPTFNVYPQAPGAPSSAAPAPSRVPPAASAPASSAPDNKPTEKRSVEQGTRRGGVQRIDLDSLNAAALTKSKATALVEAEQPPAPEETPGRSAAQETKGGRDDRLTVIAIDGTNRGAPGRVYDEHITEQATARDAAVTLEPVTAAATVSGNLTVSTSPWSVLEPACGAIVDGHLDIPQPHGPLTCHLRSATEVVEIVCPECEFADAPCPLCSEVSRSPAQ